MKLRKSLFSALLLCFASFVACGRSGSQHPDYARGDTQSSPLGESQSSPLKVEIKTAKTVVKNKNEFSVATTIRNTGSAELSIERSYCYSEWTADNTLVHIGGDCLKNSPITAILKPGNEIEGVVPIIIVLNSRTDQPVSVTFRLGIGYGHYGGAWTTSRVWSNALTVSVVK